MDVVVSQSRNVQPAAFFDRHFNEVYRYVSRRTGGGRAEVEDLVQETLLQAWRDLHRLRRPSDVLQWVLGIARNRIADAARKVGRERSHEAALRALARIDVQDPPDVILESREWGLRVRRAIHDLPAEFSEILIDYYLEEKTLRALAEERGDREDAIESRLRRARTAFRDKMIEGNQPHA